MKSLNIFCVLAVLVVGSFAFGAVENFNGIEVDIELWAGAGSNEALFVIDWNDDIDPAYKIWGYCWDDSATVRDMINTVKAEDLRLFEADGGWDGTGGESTVYGFGYDADNDGGSFIETPINDETGYATDADDHYAEGWMFGYWTQWESVDGINWTAAYGVEDTAVVDGLLTGFSWDPVFSFTETPTIPEPCTMALLGLGGLVMIRRRNK